MTKGKEGSPPSHCGKTMATSENAPLLTWQNLMGRVNHEDDLMNQRIYNFSTVQAFLTAALAFSSSGAYAEDIRFLVALFGLILALFYIPLGLGYVRGIQTLSEYLKQMELHPDVPPIITNTYIFLQTGTAAIDDNVKIALRGTWWHRKPIYKLFPWYLGFGASMLVGVGTPLLASVFWFFVLATLLGWLPSGDLRRIAGGLVIALLLTFCGHLLSGRLIPGSPYRAECDHAAQQSAAEGAPRLGR